MAEGREMKFIELHHGDDLVVVRVDTITAIVDNEYGGEHTAVHHKEGGIPFYVVETAAEILTMIKETEDGRN